MASWTVYFTGGEVGEGEAPAGGEMGEGEEPAGDCGWSWSSAFCDAFFLSSRSSLAADFASLNLSTNWWEGGEG